MLLFVLTPGKSSWLAVRTRPTLCSLTSAANCSLPYSTTVPDMARSPEPSSERNTKPESKKSLASFSWSLIVFAPKDMSMGGSGRGIPCPHARVPLPAADPWTI